MTRPNPTQLALALLAVTGLTGSVAAQAGISHFERNGYNLCMKAADQSLRGRDRLHQHLPVPVEGADGKVL